VLSEDCAKLKTSLLLTVARSHVFAEKSLLGFISLHRSVAYRAVLWLEKLAGKLQGRASISIPA